MKQLELNLDETDLSVLSSFDSMVRRWKMTLEKHMKETTGGLVTSEFYEYYDSKIYFKLHVINSDYSVLKHHYATVDLATGVMEVKDV